MTISNTEKKPSDNKAGKRMSVKEIILQAFSLLFALQDKDNFQKASNRLEKNPFALVVSGIISMIVFICIAGTGVYLALH